MSGKVKTRRDFKTVPVIFKALAVISHLIRLHVYPSPTHIGYVVPMCPNISPPYSCDKRSSDFTPLLICQLFHRGPRVIARRKANSISRIRRQTQLLVSAETSNCAVNTKTFCSEVVVVFDLVLLQFISTYIKYRGTQFVKKTKKKQSNFQKPQMFVSDKFLIRPATK